MNHDDIHSCHPWCKRPECVRQRVFEMAREAKIPSNVVDIWFGQISDFAVLVAAHEREACVKACEENKAFYRSGYNEAVSDCAAAIRARGEKA